MSVRASVRPYPRNRQQKDEFPPPYLERKIPSLTSDSFDNRVLDHQKYPICHRNSNRAKTVFLDLKSILPSQIHETEMISFESVSHQGADLGGKRIEFLLKNHYFYRTCSILFGGMTIQSIRNWWKLWNMVYRKSLCLTIWSVSCVRGFVWNDVFWKYLIKLPPKSDGYGSVNVLQNITFMVFGWHVASCFWNKNKHHLVPHHRNPLQ